MAGFNSSIVDNLLMKLATVGYNEISSAWGVKTDVQKLKCTLLTIQTILLDSELQQVDHNQGLRLWLNKLKDVCYDAEDVVDLFEAEALRKQVITAHGSLQRKVRNLISFSNPVVISFKLAHRIKKIRENLDEIASERRQFHLPEISRDHRSVVLEGRETHSFLELDEVIERDQHKHDLVKILLSSTDTSNPSVIPIVGIGGIGKTTLAKFVYNDLKVKKHFSLRVWIYVSNDFGVKQLIVKIIKSICGQDFSKFDLDQLQHKLRALLKDQRYLIMLDDVWNEDSTKWNDLKYLLMGGASGSRVIVTTRSNRVARFMGTVSPVNLKDLPFKDCLSLFIKGAFGDGDAREHPNLSKIAKEIVKKCYGIPLAVKTIGSLLSSVTDERRWIFIRDNEVWEKNLNRDDSLIAVLKLSYDNLPSPLKSCFVYCSLFPKDYMFFSVELIQCLMANGFLESHRQNEELEDVGFMYLMELWSKSFFQDFEDYGTAVGFKMHDIMHDLAISIANDECVFVDERRLQNSKNARHLVISNISIIEQEKNTFTMLGNMKNITRTFICPGLGSETFLNMCLAKLKSLRVLYLNSSYFKMLPYSIGNLKQLRVLDLAYNERIKKLPNSICKLNSLQFLDIGGCSELVETPKDMKYMISLRFLRLTTKQKSLSGTGIECLKSLRTLRLVDCENLEYLFAGMDCPPTLQTLVIFNCPSLKSLPCGLKCLASLKTLWIHSCEELDLGIKCKNENDHQDVVSFLSLQKLMIARIPKLINLPSWLLQGSLNSLETILIEYCENLTELPESLLSITTLNDLCIGSCPSLMTLPRALEHLTSLKKLRIMHCESLNLPMEEENDEDQPSGLKLKKLAIVGLPKLTALPRWLLQGSILSLETIWIVDCPQLKTLPAVIQSLISLNSLYIVDCPQLIDRCEIGAGEDFHKIAHVQKTIIIDSDQVDSQEVNSSFHEAFVSL